MSRHGFAAGEIREVGRYLAELLIDGGYAQPARRQDDVSQAPAAPHQPNNPLA